MISLDEGKVGRLLIGHRVRVSIGEPWDFEYPDGQDALPGRITAVSERGEHAEQWVRIEVTPFEAEEGSTIRHLTAKQRYVEPAGMIEIIARGEDANVNLSYADQVTRDKMPEGVSPFLIGGMRLLE